MITHHVFRSNSPVKSMEYPIYLIILYLCGTSHNVLLHHIWNIYTKLISPYVSLIACILFTIGIVNDVPVKCTEISS